MPSAPGSALATKSKLFLTNRLRENVMKRDLVVIGALIGLIWLLGAGMGTAEQKASSITGTWNCQSKGGPEGDMEFTLILEQNGDDVDGTVSSPLGDAPITSGTFKGNKLELHIDTEAGNYLLEATLDKSTLTGTWSKDQDKGTWVGKPAEAK
jgi:hypothetical protein